MKLKLNSSFGLTKMKKDFSYVEMNILKYMIFHEINIILYYFFNSSTDEVKIEFISDKSLLNCCVALNCSLVSTN